jgi:hypothetical protein
MMRVGGRRWAVSADGHRRPGALRAVVCTLIVAAGGGCATWHPLPAAEWERADSTHVDVFRTRLRVTRRDGRELYLEHPAWTAGELRGVYPAGWPRSPDQDTIVVVPRDSIAAVARLESNAGRTALYLGAVAAAVGVVLANQ